MFGYINMCRRFYAEMKSRRRGVIINVLGMAGRRMDPATSPVRPATPG